MAKQVGIAAPTTHSLLDPEISIELGTRYLREQLDNWSGNWSQTLAAYNAGPGRVKEWQSLGPFREPAEFIESIPFNETREYVQAVLRNADMYRTIYGDRHPATAPIGNLSDVPAVTLSVLPAAARTPGGGVKPGSATTSALKRPAPTRASAKKPAPVASKHPAAKKPAPKKTLKKAASA
jgi:hypothetical protein